MTAGNSLNYLADEHHKVNIYNPNNFNQEQTDINFVKKYEINILLCHQLLFSIT